MLALLLGVTLAFAPDVKVELLNDAPCAVKVYVTHDNHVIRTVRLEAMGHDRVTVTPPDTTLPLVYRVEAASRGCNWESPFDIHTMAPLDATDIVVRIAPQPNLSRALMRRVK
jgi:hypothetical protein